VTCVSGADGRTSFARDVSHLGNSWDAPPTFEGHRPLRQVVRRRLECYWFRDEAPCRTPGRHTTAVRARELEDVCSASNAGTEAVMQGHRQLALSENITVDGVIDFEAG
jgi:hypothetical protein